MKSDLRAKVRNALTENDTLRKRPLAEWAANTGPVRAAATALDNALQQRAAPAAGGPTPAARALADYYTNLKDANSKVIGALKPDGTVYDAPAKQAVVDEISRFKNAYVQLRQFEEAIRGGAIRGAKASPLLDDSARSTVGKLALGMFVAGALCAASGSGLSFAPLRDLAPWLAFGSAALAVLWVFAYFAVRRPSAPPAAPEDAGSRLQYLIFGGLAFLVLSMLAAGLLTNRLVEPLRTVPGARGLITFLIAIGTIAIAIILSLASVVMQAGDANMLKERLTGGKEILTVLVGVLGTIVGFYFASNADGPDGGRMNVQVTETKPASVKAGEHFTVSAATTGGEMPYDPTPFGYLGRDGKSEGSMVEGSVTKQGVITAKFQVSDKAPPGAIPFVIGSRDNAGKAAASPRGEVNVVPK